jgi:class 3 adenylate cyclase
MTFLFTDVESSTQLLHRLGPERYAEELSSHRQAIRDAFVRHGGVEVDKGRLEAAGRSLRTALQDSLEAEADMVVAACVDTAANVTLDLGRPFETGRLLGASDRLRGELGSVREHFEQAEHDKTRAKARSLLGDDVYEAQFELGRALSIEEAAQFALTAIET